LVLTVASFFLLISSSKKQGEVLDVGKVALSCLLGYLLVMGQHPF
jgi:hypothetical protein